MPGMKGESGKKPTVGKSSMSEGAYAYSSNRMGDADTNNIQGWNSMDGRQNQRGGNIRNSSGGYGKGGGMPKPRDY